MAKEALRGVDHSFSGQDEMDTGPHLFATADNGLALSNPLQSLGVFQVDRHSNHMAGRSEHVLSAAVCGASQSRL